MDSHLKYLLQKYNLQLQFVPSHEKGCIVKTSAGFPNLLIVKEGLSVEKVGLKSFMLGPLVSKYYVVSFEKDG